MSEVIGKVVKTRMPTSNPNISTVTVQITTGSNQNSADIIMVEVE